MSAVDSESRMQDRVSAVVSAGLGFSSARRDLEEHGDDPMQPAYLGYAAAKFAVLAAAIHTLTADPIYRELEQTVAKMIRDQQRAAASTARAI